MPHPAYVASRLFGSVIKRLTARAIVLVFFFIVPAAHAAEINLDSLLIVSVGGRSAVERLNAVTSISAYGNLVLNGIPGRFRLTCAPCRHN